MRFEEKLRKQMLLKGFNQQKLATASRVSDSEISRILSGKSVNPGVENALRLARAVGVSLDYLADDSLDTDELVPRTPTSESVSTPSEGAEAEVLAAARELGLRTARRILETVLDLGYDVAIRRLLELKPVIEVDQTRAAANSIVTSERRVNSA